ncbi:MAG: winged helix-turn-helix transcriptional regulator [Candidatus Aenigmarchaeota archaeon]|nr:winged helix-turn-helix transcriptional regulator [Candidatus Aenigmarchaeota archaeon]
MTKQKNIQLFKALSTETRYKIIEILLDGELCACKIPALIKKNQSNTSMHLAKLTYWNIIKSRRDGKKILYSIKEKKIKEIFNILKKK